MTNILRGERSFDHEGRTFTLVLDMNAFTEAGQVLNMGLMGLMKSLETDDVPLHILRALVFGALRRHHKDMTIEDVGDLIQSYGLTNLFAVIVDLVQQVMPKAKEAPGGNVTAPPLNRKQRRETAKPKTSSGGRKKP